MDAATRHEVLGRYAEHSRRFDTIASQRRPLDHRLRADVIPFHGPHLREPSSRELEVLWLISEGLTNREIGKRLYLSEETVKTHIRSLVAALQVHSRAHAVAVGFRRGIID
jgi:DNA-binding NarL/FixJ family response regulator